MITDTDRLDVIVENQLEILATLRSVIGAGSLKTGYAPANTARLDQRIAATRELISQRESPWLNGSVVLVSASGTHRLEHHAAPVRYKRIMRNNEVIFTLGDTVTWQVSGEFPTFHLRDLARYFITYGLTRRDKNGNLVVYSGDIEKRMPSR